MTNKRTRAIILGEILNLAEVKANEEYTKEIEKIIAITEKKNTNRSASKTQKENVDIKEKIIATLVELGKAVTISELQATSEEMGAYSNQKLSALMKQLVAENRAERTEEKKKAYFKAI